MPDLRIAVLDDYQDVALSSADFTRLADHAEITTFADHLTGTDAVADRLADFDVVIAMRERTPFPASLLARLPRLKLLITTGMANASIDVPAARAQGVVVCGTRSARSATAELIWGLIMSVYRNLPAEDASMRAGQWQRYLGRELSGSTLGIIGLGNLGQTVARYARAFEMKIVAWSQNLTAETAAEHGAELVGKRELFERSDIATVHLKLSDRSRGLVGPDELAALGPRGYLVNTSRGPIVDETALVAALRSGTIAGAALDVYDVEPLPAEHPLRALPNTVLTPHIGFVAEDSYRTFYTDAVDDVRAWLSGTPIRQLP